MSFAERFPVKKQFVHGGRVFPGSQVSPEKLMVCREMDVLDEDVVLVGYPRSGNRWTAEILSWIQHDGSEEKIRASNNFFRCPLIEMTGCAIFPAAVNASGSRLYSTHLTPDLAPRLLAAKSKLVWVVRNPKDVAVSFFHFYRNNNALGPYTGSWDDFYEGFKAGQMIYGSYFEWVTSWWECKQQRHKEMMILSYQQMKRDPAQCVKQLAKFLSKDLTDEAIQLILERTSFEQMKQNPDTNFTRHPEFKANFLQEAECVRKGLIGDWKNYFTVKQSEEVDEMMEKDLLPEGLRSLIAGAQAAC